MSTLNSVPLRTMALVCLAAYGAFAISNSCSVVDGKRVCMSGDAPPATMSTPGVPTEGGYRKSGLSAMLQSRSDVQIVMAQQEAAVMGRKEASLESKARVDAAKTDLTENSGLEVNMESTAASEARSVATQAVTAIASATLNAGARMRLHQKRMAAGAKAKSNREKSGAHLEMLRSAVTTMDASIAPSNGELENIMQQFMDAQAASQDKCPSLLLEAKHQLNTLHLHMHELVVEINATEMSAHSEEYELETEYAEYNETEETYQLEKQKCEKEVRIDLKMYYILIAELHEMWMIANPGVTMDVSGATAQWMGEASAIKAQTASHQFVHSSASASAHSSSSGHQSGTYIAGGVGGTSYAASGHGGFDMSHISGGSSGNIGGIGNIGGNIGNVGNIGGGNIGNIGGGNFGNIGGGNIGNVGGGNIGGGFGNIGGGNIGGGNIGGGTFGNVGGGNIGNVGGGNIGGGFGNIGGGNVGGTFGSSSSSSGNVGGGFGNIGGGNIGGNIAGGNMFGGVAGGGIGGTTFEGMRLLQSEATEQKPTVVGNAAKSSADPNAAFARAAQARGSLDGTRELISKTKKLATDLTQCVASRHSQQTVSLSQEAVHESQHPVLDNLGTGAGQAGSILDSAGKGQIADGVGTGAGFGHSWEHSTGDEYGAKGWSASHSSSHASAHASSWGHSRAHSSGVYHSVGNKGGNCDYQIQLLQVVYIKAWLQITRLVAEYEWMIHLHTCDDFVKETTVKKERQIEEKIEKLTVKITSYAEKLLTFKARYQAVWLTVQKLTVHVKGLSRQCQAMGATVSSLDKVRDAIHVIGLCPGLGRISFVTPSWDGVSSAKGIVNVVGMDDQTIDVELHAMCKRLNASFRAVETSELMLRTVSGLPLTNTMTVPLMGPCPNCEGDDDEKDILTDALIGEEHQSGHSRVCWDPDSPLDTANRRTDCGTTGMKAVFCVDAHDSKWGNITSWEDISSYEYSGTFSHSQGLDFTAESR